MAENEIEIEKKKEFVYRGRPLEEMRKMNLREFAKFLPSRQRRTLMRNSDVVEKFILRCNKKIAEGKPIRTHNRGIIIVPEMIGMVIFVHGGRSFEQVRIISEMIGHRLGEFTLTRRPVKHGAAGIGATRSSASRSVK